MTSLGENMPKLSKTYSICSCLPECIIAHVTYDDYNHVYEFSSPNHTEEIPALVSTTSPPYKNNSLNELHIFPDSETSIYTSSWT